MGINQPVLFEVLHGKGGHLGVITLNRAPVLNSLNLEMIRLMQSQLNAWREDSAIKAVVVKAVPGRAFCAGGDLSYIYRHAEDRDTEAQTQFFREEYQLNKTIYHYTKPYIAFLDGITMGGGVGISIHGSHRIATENLLFAMPETGIGFFPDVGGTYFLPRLTNQMGIFCGLTGARLKWDDCIHLAIAQHKVNSEQLPELLAALQQTEFNTNANESVSQIIHTFKVDAVSTPLQEAAVSLGECFLGRTMEEILENLTEKRHVMGPGLLEDLAKKSPTSLKVTLAALQRGKQLSFDECMDQELKLTAHFLKGHDFREGIRAFILDKDKNPNWQPSLLAAVTSDQVQAYFNNLAKAAHF